MPKMPRISGDDAVRAFKKAGFEVVRISGSHHILSNGNGVVLSIPVHSGKTVGLGLLKSQIKLTGMSQETFQGLL